MLLLLRCAAAIAVLLLGGCGSPWNNPYPASERGANIFYTSFSERPKHLDPVQSYSENEYALIANIYMPPLQYHYLLRPYELVPFAAEQLPRPQYFDKNDRPLPDTAPADQIAYIVYDIHIRSGLAYQPHPAFARDSMGQPLYLDLSERDLRGIRSLGDFKETGTREVIAADYVYEIKRLASPRLHSPIFGLMSQYIVGLKEYAERVHAAAAKLPADAWVDLNQDEISGVSVVDRYTYRIRVKGKYPQFLYWLAMPFFSPIPVEADRFYAQPGMAERNLSFDWYPVGSGPYMLTRAQPEPAHGARAQPELPGEPYPSRGRAGRQGGGPAGRCRATDALHRPGRVLAWRRKASPTGTSSCRATTTPPGSPPTPSTR